MYFGEFGKNIGYFIFALSRVLICRFLITAYLADGGFMKKIVSLVLMIALSLGIVAALSSCGKAPKDEGAQIAVYLGEEVYDFDPTDYYVNRNAEQLMSMLYEPLFKINEKGKLELAAASDYSVDEEENTIVINIDESYWSDGVQLKAADYIYAWRDRILDPNNANPAAALFYDIENAVQVKNGEKSIYDFGAVASDIYEITIKYREGANYEQLLRNLATVASSPARQDIVGTASGHWSKSHTSIVTNGPFRISYIDFGTNEFTLERNLGYHQNPSTVDFDNKVIPGALVSFINGAGEELLFTYEDITNKAVFIMLDASMDMRAESADLATYADDLSTYTYVFNTTNPLFANPKVRYALSLALDRKAMAAEVAVFAKAAESFVSAPIADKLYEDLDKPVSASADAIRAKEILDSVDLTGVSMSFTLSVNDDEVSVALAKMAKEAWQALGFNVTVKAVKNIKTTVYDQGIASNIEIIDSGIQVIAKNASYGVYEYDVLGLDWQMYSDDPFVALSAFTSYMNGCGTDFSTGAYRMNISAWWSTEYDALMAKAYNAKTPEQRAAALREAEALLLESCPVIPVLYNRNFVFSSDLISGIEVDGCGNFIFTKVKQKNYQSYLPAPEEDPDNEDEGEETEE